MRSRGLLQIGEVAERVGLSLRTVRYYEEAGLVSPCERTEGGFRLYGEEGITRLRLIMQMKPLGFSLPEMRELLDARDSLAQAEPDGDAYEQAWARLDGFAGEAKVKTEQLRDQLEVAEAFAAELGRELRRARRSASSRAT